MTATLIPALPNNSLPKVNACKYGSIEADGIEHVK